jgi:hypothetical protein
MHALSLPDRPYIPARQTLQGLTNTVLYLLQHLFKFSLLTLWFLAGNREAGYCSSAFGSLSICLKKIGVK